MSTERVTLAGIVASIRQATEKEIFALQQMLRLLDQEERDGVGYRSGVDFGAYSATALMILEKQVQTCIEICQNILEPLINEGAFQRCREPFWQMTSNSRFDDTLRQGITILEIRRHDLQGIEQMILQSDSETVARLLPEKVRRRMEEDIEKEISKLEDGL